ncbi:MAG: ATP-binding cassette domain-containing protein [Betaproteobacteria bacterium]|nr:ATP-binding cassette domain-containing protein [Betaproteobacteria bacterium]
MLELRDLHVDIASAQVLRGFSLSLSQGQMVGLVGRNGAGKTSTLRTIMGHLPLRQGQLRLCGQDLTRLPPEARAGLGVGYMPEDRGLVPELTVEENMLIPLWVSKTLVVQDRMRLVYQVLPELKEMSDRRALLLSGGQQKLVALGRALAVGTRLLLLDEPFEGVAPALAMRIAEVLHQLKGADLSVLMSQSELNHSSGLLDTTVVIERGANVLAKGSP